MSKIRTLERLLEFDRDPEERTKSFSLTTSFKDTLITNAATYRSVRNETTTLLLLDLILNKTPIYKDGYFIFDREFCNDDLKEFANFVSDHKAIVECQLSIVRKDLREKATTQLGIFLSMLGLSTETVRKDQKGGKATYYYKLSRSDFDEAKGIIDRRRLHPKDSYYLEYWSKIHQSNGFTTPVYTRIEDQIGCTQYVDTYWLPTGKKLGTIQH
jgi:hypothetical protein